MTQPEIANATDNMTNAISDFAATRAPVLWQRDPALWTSDEAVAATISNRLGWLDCPAWAATRVDELVSWATSLPARGVQHIVLLGMGGSSLAPEVCASVFGQQSDRPILHVLDNTHPDAIRAVESRIDLARTLFVVASKSGSTIETRCFSRYFFERAKSIHGDNTGDWFVAITDADSDLQKEASELGFSRTFVNPTDIGGRYSALSYFGLVPAAACGLDVQAMVRTSGQFATHCRQSAESAIQPSPAVSLGVTLGTLAGQGRNKLTLLASELMQPLGVWIEQLVAESTGKQNQGIVPITGETPREPAEYGNDRVFTVTRTVDDIALEKRAQALRDAGHPVIEWTIASPGDLGAEFFRWEMATAVAGAVMAINPFDEPNVTESKNKTAELLGRVLDGQSIDAQAPDSMQGGLNVWGSSNSLNETLASWKRDGDYLAILAYGPINAEAMDALETLRDRLGRELGIPATLGIGPRFLHSTGQLHKGGDDSGMFLQITSDSGDALTVPGEEYEFGQLNACQALGDLEVLREHGRRVVRIHAGASPAAITAIG